MLLWLYSPMRFCFSLRGLSLQGGYDDEYIPSFI